MPSYFEKLVAEHGQEYARQYMRDIRSKVNPKNIKGGAFRDKAFAKEMSQKAAKARHEKAKSD